MGWCTVDASQRLGITFMPNVVWSADIADSHRSFLERSCSVAMSVASNIGPFSMAFVSGALEGAIQAGYTPPGLLSEDELMFTKKMCLLPRASTYRLSSIIMKVFYPPEADSKEFGGKVYVPKLERWFAGWVEVHAYLSTWLFGRRGLKDHPPIAYPLRTFGVLVLTVFRLYSSFIAPLSALPSMFVLQRNWSMYFSGEDLIDDTLLFYLLRCQSLISGIFFMLGSIQMLRVQWRLYHKFDCMKWSYSTILAILMGMPLLMYFPLRLLWCFFIHGIRNRPVAHTANLDKFKITQPTSGSANVLHSCPQPKTQDPSSSSSLTSKGIIVDANANLDEHGCVFPEKLSKSSRKPETDHVLAPTLLQSRFASWQESKSVNKEASISADTIAIKVEDLV